MKIFISLRLIMMFNELNRKKVAEKQLLSKCENPIPLKNRGSLFWGYADTNEDI